MKHYINNQTLDRCHILTSMWTLQHPNHIFDKSRYFCIHLNRKFTFVIEKIPHISLTPSTVLSLKLLYLMFLSLSVEGERYSSFTIFRFLLYGRSSSNMNFRSSRVLYSVNLNAINGFVALKYTYPVFQLIFIVI